MKDINKKVSEALEHTFNNAKVSRLSDAQYKEYILMCATLTLGTMIKNEGHQFVLDFCQGALNNTDETPVVQQVRRH